MGPAPPVPAARAFVLGLVIVAAFTVAGCFSVLLRYEIIGTGYLPRGAVTILLLLLGATGVVRVALRRTGLRRQELLLVFGMLLAMATIPGQDFAQHVYLNPLGIVYYATPDIAKPRLYLEDLNPDLVPSKDRRDPIVRWAFEGVPPGAHVPWRQWARPLLVWTPFYFALYWVILCGSALLAQRWQDQEKVLYPLTSVPAELVGPDTRPWSPLLRNRLLWGCFLLPVVIYVLKGLHTYFPTVPDIDMQRDGGALFAEGPARVFNYLPLHLYPEMIGIAYLLSGEVGFSLWFFYWLRLIETFVRECFGFTANHSDFFSFQTVGGYAVLAIALLWSARRYLARAFRGGFAALVGRGHADDALHVMAGPGLVSGLAFIFWWCAKVGMSLSWAMVMYVSFVLVSLVVSRVICEAGMFLYSSPFRVHETIFDLAGVARVGGQNVTLMTMTSWTETRGTAAMTMPSVFMGFKLATLGGADRRLMFWSMYAGIVVSILASHVSCLYIIYHWSVPKLGWWPSGSALSTTNSLARILESPEQMTAGGWASLAGGGGLTFFLVAMRQRFLWWPWHPLGFVAWLGWPIDRYWLSIFLGWLAKVMVVRLAGYKAFARLRPAAFGLILGICFILTVWLVIHMFLPGPPLLIE